MEKFGNEVGTYILLKNSYRFFSIDISVFKIFNKFNISFLGLRYEFQKMFVACDCICFIMFKIIYTDVFLKVLIQFKSLISFP